MTPEPGPDPIRERRQRVARLASRGQRLGYALFLIATALFAASLVTELTSTLATAILLCLAAGSVVLAPSIVAGFAARAAEREDRERGL